MKNTYVVILAGGKGTRMATELPKVLVEVAGQSLISRVLDAVEKSSIANKPVVVVGYKADLVQNALADRASYVFQSQQLGTGHAVKVTQAFLNNKASSIIVLYGDHPLISPTMLDKLMTEHHQNGDVITLATAIVPDFNDWRSAFLHFGRIERGSSGEITDIIEYKDADDRQRLITEVNPGYYCFRADWLWPRLIGLSNNNAQREYYLTDLIAAAFKEKQKLSAINIAPHEALGINSREQLEIVENYIRSLE